MARKTTTMKTTLLPNLATLSFSLVNNFEMRKINQKLYTLMWLVSLAAVVSYSFVLSRCYCKHTHEICVISSTYYHSTNRRSKKKEERTNEQENAARICEEARIVADQWQDMIPFTSPHSNRIRTHVLCMLCTKEPKSKANIEHAVFRAH